MAKAKGINLLVKRGNADGPPETFTTIAYMRSTGMTFNGEQVDVTTKTDATWRQLMAGVGIQSMSISLAGIASDDATLDSLIADFFAHVHKNYQIVSDVGDTFGGAFQLASIERTGEYNGEETFSVTLESAGDITYTP